METRWHAEVTQVSDISQEIVTEMSGMDRAWGTPEANIMAAHIAPFLFPFPLHGVLPNRGEENNISTQVFSVFHFGFFNLK